MKRRSRILRGFWGAMLAAFLTGGVSSPAAAQFVSGYVDLNYSENDTRTSSPEGTTKTTSESFLQRYNLNYNAQLYPFLSLRLGYLYERILGESESGGEESESRLTRMSPSVSLDLSNPRFGAGVGFVRREQRQRPGGVDLISDAYNASFGLKQEENQPTLNLFYSRRYFYDPERIVQDTVFESSSVSSRYRPVQELELQYQIGYTETEDRLKDLRSTGLGNNARVSYSNDFFGRTVSLNTNYSAGCFRSETFFSGSGGEVLFPVTPVQGISGDGPMGTTTPPETPLLERMTAKPLLVDSDTAAGTDINIGYTPLNQDPRSIGLVFAKPEDMNVLYVFINQDITFSQDPPLTIANSFIWDVYVSSDTLPIDSGAKQWKLWQQAAPAVFNSFDRRFEISFPTVQTQFIKVVTRPLSAPVPALPPLDINSILVTELQPNRRVDAETVRGRVMRTFSHIYDLNIRTRIMDAPVLVYHDFYSMIQDSDQAESRYVVANALTASRRFSRVFSGTSRIGREDSNEKRGHRTSYAASMAITATPLRTLGHSLVLSTQQETVGNERSTTESAFLNNYAEFYRGISISAGGGVSTSSTSGGTETKSSLFNAGSTIIPHRTLSISANHSRTAIEQSGEPVDEQTSRTTTNGAALSYSPFPALYLSASIAQTSGRDTKRNTVENYAVSWSPLVGGALQFSASYSQQIQQPSNDKTTTAGPGVSWRVNPRLIVSGSYSRLRVESARSTTRSESFNVNARWMF